MNNDLNNQAMALVRQWELPAKSIGIALRVLKAEEIMAELEKRLSALEQKAK